MNRPNFFIVGAPKCGTTALYEYLKPHPEIFLPEIKEPYYFGRDMTGTLFEVYRRSEADYLALFQEAAGEKRIGEASPSYLASKLAPGEIHAFDPTAKIIIMLRNPVEMLQSMYHHRRYMGDEPAASFEAALEAELEGKPAVIDALPYLLLANFSAGVRRYFEIFGRENVLVIVFDDFKRDLPLVYRRVLEFLEVDPSFQPDFQVVNASKEVRSPLLQNLLERLRLTPKHLRDSALFRAFSRALPPRLYQAFISAGTRLYTRPQSYQPMNPEFRKRLQAFFRPQLEELGQLLQRDLSAWYQD